MMRPCACVCASSGFFSLREMSNIQAAPGGIFNFVLQSLHSCLHAGRGADLRSLSSF